jgi:uncharacterized protein
MALLGSPRRVRELDPIEFAVVVLITFGDSIIGSVIALLRGAPVYDFVQHGQLDARHVGDMVGYELAVLPMIALVLYRGGWTLADFKLGVTWRDTRAGFVLWVAGVAILGILHVVSQLLFGADAEALRRLPNPRAEDAPSLALFAAAFVVNPLFEELIVVAYVMEALKLRYGTGVAIHASVAIRMLYHLYQGPYAILWYGAYGLLAAHAYVRWQRLWPLVVAHALHDCVAFALLRLNQ